MCTKRDYSLKTLHIIEIFTRKQVESSIFFRLRFPARFRPHKLFDSNSQLRLQGSVFFYYDSCLRSRGSIFFALVPHSDFGAQKLEKYRLLLTPTPHPWLSRYSMNCRASTRETSEHPKLLFTFKNIVQIFVPKT